MAAVALTLVTLAAASAAIVAATSAGCSLLRGARCSAHNTASLTSPTPTFTSQSPSPSAGPSAAATPSPSALATPASPPPGGPLPPNYNPVSGAPYYPPSSSGGVSQFLPTTVTCSLPYVVAGIGGFVTYPEAKFIADPKSSVALPTGGGPDSLSYDWPLKKWLPVAPSSVSPDGGHYAFVLPGKSGVYVVDAATNAFSSLGQERNWSLVAVANKGLYAGDAASGGLWFVSYSGSIRQLTPWGHWQAVWADTFAFGSMTSVVPKGATNTIVRLDLVTGSIASWFTDDASRLTVDGAQSTVVGFDGAGNPIIYTTDIVHSSWIVSAPGQAKPLSNQAGWSIPIGGAPLADSNGIWFVGDQGPVLYTSGRFYGMGALFGSIAGGCR